MKKYDLEDRLVGFAIMVIEICELAMKQKLARHLSEQLLRSGTAPALLYGEVQAAESRADFIHKMKVLLKELRETRIILRILRQKPFVVHGAVDMVFNECNELIGIFTKSIQTAKQNQELKKYKSKI